MSILMFRIAKIAYRPPNLLKIFRGLRPWPGALPQTPADGARLAALRATELLPPWHALRAHRGAPKYKSPGALEALIRHWSEESCDQHLKTQLF